MIRCEKQVRIGFGKGRRGYVSVTREHYLRDDISCKVENCTLCTADGEPANRTSGLGPNVTHYVIPDTPVLTDYHDVVEHPSMQGVILLQTPLSYVRSKKGRRSYSKLVGLLGRVEKQCVMFSNENHVETFTPQAPEETTRQWHTRLILRAGVWYSNHIQAGGGATSIIILTTDAEYEAFPKPEPGENVKVATLGDYLHVYLPTHTDLHALYNSLLEIAEVSSAGKEKTEFTSYLSEALIKEGQRKGHIVCGTLHVSNSHPRDEAYVRMKFEDKGQSSGSGEILIYGNVSRNRSIHGDGVAVQVLPKSQWRTRSGQLADSADSGSNVMTTGVVVGVLSRKEREYVASFDESAAESSSGSSKSTKVLVYPYNRRVPKIRISTRQAEDLKGHRIVVRIDSWEVDSQYPNGHFVRSIGPIGSLETETNVILIEHNLSSNTFSKALLNELPTNSPESPWCVEEGCGQRRDLRTSHLVFSIDPQGCEDVDDTLSVRSLKNGHTELGVHIADVSHFVRPGSQTDEEACRRSTTVYLADRRFDMLPAILSADLCSLLSNVDRYAVSVIWNLDSSYRVHKVWYGRTIIRSKYKLAYETAQELFDGASMQSVLKDIPELQNPPLSVDELKKRGEELCDAIGKLVTISRVLRHRRAMEGALELESVEVKVQINDKDSTDIKDLIPKQPLEMHEVIAECMIFANHWVAKKIYEVYPTQALLRHHPPPSLDKLAVLVATAQVRGFTITTDSNKALAESLNNCVDPQDPEVNKILRNLATQAMNQAEYFSTGSLPNKDYFHYGLALDLYTHFTSPIRRYADLIVHRQLLSALDDHSEDPSLLPGNNRLIEIAQHMNDRHRSAQMAQLASMELFQCLYFKSGVGREAGDARDRVEGVVVGIRTNGITVFVPRYGIRSLVYLRDKNGLVLQPSSGDMQPENLIFNTGSLEVTSHRVTVTFLSGSYTLRLFDHLLLRVCVESSHAHGLSLALKLLKIHPLDTESLALGGVKSVNKALIKTVQAEAENEDEVRYSQDLKHSIASEYSQSSSEHSLYCVIQSLHKLSLVDISP